MLPVQRQQRILELLEQQGVAKVEWLSERVNVSPATVRRDLDQLSQRGLIDRVHGGAALQRETAAFEPLYVEKRQLYLKEKERIGKAAAERVAPGETIILDSGSTTFHVARYLRDIPRLTVITDDLMIAVELSSHPDMTVVMLGGIIRTDFLSVVGPLAESNLEGLNADRAFLAADAIDFQRGVTNATFHEVNVKRLMHAAARETVLVVDHSKFRHVAMVQVCPLDVIDGIITDSGLDDVTVEKLTNEKMWVQRV